VASTSGAKKVAAGKNQRGSAAAASKRQASQFKASKAAKPGFKTASGKTVKVAGTPGSKRIRNMSSKDYSTLGARRNTAFNNREGMRTPAQRTTIINNYGGSHYGDPYSGLFMYSLTPMYASTFHYNHWGSYSLMRQQSLMRENAQLQTQMAAMSGPRNPNYAPPGTDAALMHSPEFVEAAYNPTPVAPVKKGMSGFARFLTLVTLCGAGYGCWYVFIRRQEA
jgi:hypothetical protein